MDRSSQQERDVVFGKVGRRRSVLAPQRIGQRRLALLQREDLFLDRADRDHPVDEHRLALADTVGAVDRLRLNGRVSPPVGEDDGIGGLKVEARPPGLRLTRMSGTSSAWNRATGVAILARAG